ncbi:hypothetical protein LSPH26S_03817 [Lysinibacillus sphaericus]
MPVRARLAPTRRHREPQVHGRRINLPPTFEPAAWRDADRSPCIGMCFMKFQLAAAAAALACVMASTARAQNPNPMDIRWLHRDRERRATAGLLRPGHGPHEPAGRAEAQRPGSPRHESVRPRPVGCYVARRVTAGWACRYRCWTLAGSCRRKASWARSTCAATSRSMCCRSLPAATRTTSLTAPTQTTPSRCHAGNERIAARGAVDDLALVIGEGVMEGRNGVGGNLHLLGLGWNQLPACRHKGRSLTEPAATPCSDRLDWRAPWRHALPASPPPLLPPAHPDRRPARPGLPPTPSARVTPADSALAERIDALIGQPRFARASWGIAVVSLDSGAHALRASRRSAGPAGLHRQAVHRRGQPGHAGPGLPLQHAVWRGRSSWTPGQPLDPARQRRPHPGHRRQHRLGAAAGSAVECAWHPRGRGRPDRR